MLGRVQKGRHHSESCNMVHNPLVKSMTSDITDLSFANYNSFHYLILDNSSVKRNVIILAFGLHGSVKSMEAKYAEMLTAGITPTTATFNERLNVCVLL